MALLDSALKVLEYFTGWMFNRTERNNSPVIVDNERAKQDVKIRDDNAELIKKAQAGDLKAQEELRKRSSE